MFVPFRSTVAIWAILYTAYTIGYLALFYLAFICLSHIRKINKNELNVDQYGTSVYVILLVIIFIGFLIMNTSRKEYIENTSIQILSGRCYIEGSFTILIAILPGRMARQESIKAKVNIIFD